MNKYKDTIIVIVLLLVAFIAGAVIAYVMNPANAPEKRIKADAAERMKEVSREESMRAFLQSGDLDKLGEHAPTFSAEEAYAIAQESPCGSEGAVVEDSFHYTIGTKMWWFDMEMAINEPHCNAVCIVDDRNQSAELTWRCTQTQQVPLQ